MEDVIVNSGCLISFTHKGFIEIIDVDGGVDAYRSQKRGGKGIKDANQYELYDFVELVFSG